MGFETEDYGKLGGMESTSTLFEKVVPIQVTKTNAEDWHMDLTARFIMGLSKTHRSTKVLQVQITNELDPYFFYSLEVNKDDFKCLKVEQCILVDFATFPYKFIELLEQCIVSSCMDNPRSALEASLKEAQVAADRADKRASASATKLSKCCQVIEKL